MSNYQCCMFIRSAIFFSRHLYLVLQAFLLKFIVEYFSRPNLKVKSYAYYLLNLDYAI